MAIDPRKYGMELSQRVADFLMQKGDICYSHRDYCGVGFCFRNGEFLYDYVYDGAIGGGPPYPSCPSPIKRFSQRSAFVAWLSEQSDESLSGAEEPVEALPLCNNQRITRERLEKHVAEL